ncbi:hypothetical protein SAMN04489735_103536 [Aneurinibacillus thermoaerophilus]|uniref:Uncharacterized protein n=1 Tax=Aneurinibacillus thermoaerophilus TaxID=143495 RepID=A0A1G8DQE2_ANETH|nr:hypothetical protein ACH33_18220 [Aneurinibacillus sp. XH2]SDH59872.1 hypothetical protein SAMN04489735_103536 [Aneurinibacillus thermoaerophilus]
MWKAPWQNILPESFFIVRKVRPLSGISYFRRASLTGPALTFFCDIISENLLGKEREIYV